MPEWLQKVVTEPVAALGFVCVLLGLIVYRRFTPSRRGRISLSGDSGPSVTSPLQLERRISSLEGDMTDIKRRSKQTEATVAELSEALKDHLTAASQQMERFIRVEASMEHVRENQALMREDVMDVKVGLRSADDMLRDVIKILERLTDRDGSRPKGG